MARVTEPISHAGLQSEPTAADVKVFLTRLARVEKVSASITESGIQCMTSSFPGGVDVLKEELQDGERARKRVELATIAFGGGINLTQSHSTVDEMHFTPCSVGGDTPMGEAITVGLALLDETNNERWGPGYGNGVATGMVKLWRGAGRTRGPEGTCLWVSQGG